MSIVSVGFWLCGALLVLAARASMQLSARLQYDHPAIWVRVGRPFPQDLGTTLGQISPSAPVGGFLTYILYGHYRDLTDRRARRYGDTARYALLSAIVLAAAGSLFALVESIA